MHVKKDKRKKLNKDITSLGQDRGDGRDFMGRIIAGGAVSRHNKLKNLISEVFDPTVVKEMLTSIKSDLQSTDLVTKNCARQWVSEYALPSKKALQKLDVNKIAVPLTTIDEIRQAPAIISEAYTLNNFDQADCSTMLNCVTAAAEVNSKFDYVDKYKELNDKMEEMKKVNKC